MALDSSCILCQGNAQQSIYGGLKKCVGCGFVFADLALSDDSLKKIYHSGYFQGDVYADYLQEKGSLQLNFKRRLDDIACLLGPLEKKNLFEIGSAYGFFLELARARFAQVRGIDISEDAAKNARDVLKLEVATGDFLRLPVEAGFYDVFCLWDVIEHLKAPHLFVEKIGRVIRPGGLVCLTTGDIESYIARFQKSHWRLIQPPYHLFYFSAVTIRRLLENYGFEIVSIKYEGIHRSFKSLLAGYRDASLCKLFPASLLSASFYLNLFDVMCVVARKK